MPLTHGTSDGRAGEIQGGYRFQNGGMATIGAGVSIGSRQEQLGLYDMNGDGLPDQVYRDGDRIVVLYNQNAPDVPPNTHPLFDADPTKIVMGMNQMGREGTWGWNLNAGVHDLESFSGTYSETSSRLGARLADIDGDGYLDMLGHSSWFGHPCPQGTCFTTAPFGVVDSTDPYADPVLSGILDNMHQQMMLADPVVQWTAPHAGHVVVSGTAHKHQTGGADGVTLELFRGDTLQEAVMLAAGDVATHPFPTNPTGMDVLAGDTVYLRLKTGADDAIGADGTPLDRVDADLHVDYQTTCIGMSCSPVTSPAMGDSNGSPLYSFSSSFDHRVAGSPTFVVAPVSGTLFVHGSVFKSATAADLRACVQRFVAATPGAPPPLDVACGGPETVGPVHPITRQSGGTTGISQSVLVEAGQIVMVRIESDLSYDPKSVRFDRAVLDQPIITYTSVCLPENGTVCTNDSASLSAFTFPTRITNDFGPFLSLVPPAVDPLVAPISAQVTVNPISVDHGVIRISTDRQGTVFWFDCLAATCSNVPVPLFAVTAGEALYFEIGSASGAWVANATGSFWSTPFSTPVLVRQNGVSPLTDTPFPGGYHGWRFGLWNEALAFLPTELLADYPYVGLLPSARQQEIAASISVPQTSFGHLGDGIIPVAWIGPSSVAYVAAGSMNAGYIGLLPDGGSAADGGGMLSANYVRQSGTKSFTLATGLSSASGVFSTSLSLNVGASDTTTTTDALDMNGDGVIDVLAGDHVTLGAMSTDLVGLGRIVLPPAANGLRKHHGFDYGIKLGGGVVVPVKSSSGRILAETAHNIDYGGLGTSLYVGYGVGRSETTDDLMDVNGDGLPDLIRRVGPKIKVRLNLGYRFGAEESFGEVAASLLPGAMPIDRWQTRENDVASWTNLVGVSAPDTTSDALEHQTAITEQHIDSSEWVVYSASSVTTRTWSRVTRQVADLNGDGLPDLLFKRDVDSSSGPSPIIVQYNYGGTFGPPVNWDTPSWDVPLGPSIASELAAFGLVGPDVLSGSAKVESTSHTSTLTLPIPYTQFTVGGATSTSTTPDSVELALDDLDGDGTPDHVLRTSGTSMAYVKYNKVTGAANLLRAVHRPLGGSFTLAYKRMGNTVDMPHSRHVLVQVVVDDGVSLGGSFASPNLVTSFSYEHGVYSRLEKEFFGFEKVTTTRGDGVTVEDDFQNAPNLFSLHGLLMHEYKRAGTAILEQHDLAYSILPVVNAGGNPLTGNLSCTLQIPALLARVPDACTPSFPIVTQDSVTYGETSGAKTHTTLVLASDYDRFGNVRASTDCGDDAIANDGIYATASYLNDPTHWVLGRPAAMQVQAVNSLACVAGLGVGGVLRSRTGEYDSYGDLIATHVDTGSGIATSTFGYDPYGNLNHVTTPPNEASQSQIYDITFDPDVATYPASVTDGFGYRSKASYDARFGVATKETDVNGQARATTLDKFGRIIGLKGPYDTLSSGIAITYSTSSVPASAVVVEAASAPTGFTGPVPPSMLNSTFVDGLGRTIELNKYAVVNGVAGMVSSGLVSRDPVGRVVRSQNPFFTPGLIATFIAPQVTAASTTTYDTHDRPLVVTYPDLAAQSNTYDVAAAPNGISLFLNRSVDPNGHPRESYVDLNGRVRAFVEHPKTTVNAVTAYDYLPTGELSQITDAEGHISSLQYDLRGLRTSANNPDEGQIDEQYDLMGNRVGHVEPNHRVLGTRVHYIYDRNRLSQIEYPQKPGVKYTYGPANAPDFGAGRLLGIDDESGTKTLEYGAIGEVRRATRTVIDSTVTPSTTTTFDFHSTYDSLGRELQLVYPDGEIVTNTYDLGGMLTQVGGVGKTWSRTYVSNLRYDVFGNQIHAQFGNGDVSDWSFDPLRVRLTNLKTKLANATPVQNLVYQYDPAGNPTEIDNSLPASPVDNSLPGTTTQKFAYDGADQLLSALGTGTMGNSSTTNFNLSFTYSTSRNITRKILAHAVVDSASHSTNPADTNYDLKYDYSGSPHLPTTIGDIQLTYDASGNPESRKSPAGTQKLTWDDDNRLVQISGWGAKQRNVYDASG
ncbi:MAG: toxin TcdB middle/N-terminal domain-containing protein, partial [Kofleriaceae bacterium]